MKYSGWKWLFFLALCFIPFLCSRCTTRSPDLNLVFVSIDTLRADHLGCYGYDRDTSPNIDRFAKNGILFKNAFSHSPKTAPSHMSMFTSQYSTVHGVFMFDRRRGAIPYVLDEKITPLAEILAQNDYTCVGFTGGGNVSEEYGFNRGFHIYDSSQNHWKKGIAWLRNNYQKKFFVFFHTYAVHDPYLPPEPYFSMFDPEYKGKIARIDKQGDWFKHKDAFWDNVDKNDPRDIRHLIALYDGSIKYMDDRLMKPLFAVLEELDLLDKTVIVFTSDHGEEFKEHGQFVHEQVYDELLHVPLILSLPSFLAEEVKVKAPDVQVRLIDLMPTILDLLDIKHSQRDLQGVSLRPVMAGKEKDDRILYGCRIPSWSQNKPRIRNNVIRQKGFKLIHNVRNKQKPWELYDLSSDPGEKISLHDEQREKANELTGLLRQIIKENQQFKESRGYRARHAKFEKDTLQKLRALGYIE